MRGRTSASERRRRLVSAQTVANQQARTFRVPRRTRAGELLTGHKLIPVTSTRKRNNLIEQGARPVLATSEWRAIYEEIGL